LATAWAAEAVREIGTIAAPAWTWNVLVTAVVGFMVWSLQRKIGKSEELKDKLIANAIASLEKSITDWQAGAKERTASLCKKIDELAMRKVENHECEKTHRTIDKVIDELKNRIYPT
jgi:hypothetical protein